MAHGVSRHHVIYERPDYREDFERDFRSYPGLVVPMYDQFHLPDFPGSLHAELAPPQKPHTAHILGALIMLDSMRTKFRGKALEVIPRLADYLLAHNEPMGAHLCEQLRYIKIGVIK